MKNLKKISRTDLKTIKGGSMLAACTEYSCPENMKCVQTTTSFKCVR